MEEEVHILGATLLATSRGPRRDQRAKNLCVNLLGFMGVYGKTKDTQARDDEQIYITYDGINHIAHTQTGVSQ
jgi:hypothetical protein